jgi:integrase
MARPKSLKPAYCLKKSDGRAFVTLDGKPVYLGRYGTQESRDQYDRAIAEWIIRGRQAAPTPGADGSPAEFTVAQMILAFWRHAETYYQPDEDGKSEADNFRFALRPLRLMYGDTPAAEFGPLKLKAFRDAMLKPRRVQRRRRATDPQTGKASVKEVEVEIAGWSRRYANKQVNRIRHVFKWATEQELIPPTVYHGLRAVAALKKGHTHARERPAVMPAPDDAVEAVLKRVGPQLKAMIELEAITGMRPNEVRRMRACDIDRARGEVWVYRPPRHKTAHHDHSREIMLGPRAQAILAPFLAAKIGEAHLFSPKDAEAWRREQQRLARKTPVQPSQVRRAELAARRQHKRPPRDHYDKDSYNQAIRRACEAAELAIRFTPNQLRHSAATRFRELYDLDTAQVLLGHRLVTTTQIYAEKNVKKAREVMSQVG